MREKGRGNIERRQEIKINLGRNKENFYFRALHFRRMGA
jgi:hypothetical protein